MFCRNSPKIFPHAHDVLVIEEDLLLWCKLKSSCCRPLPSCVTSAKLSFPGHLQGRRSRSTSRNPRRMTQTSSFSLTCLPPGLHRVFRPFDTCKRLTIPLNSCALVPQTTDTLTRKSCSIDHSSSTLVESPCIFTASLTFALVRFLSHLTSSVPHPVVSSP